MSKSGKRIDFHLPTEHHEALKELAYQGRTTVQGLLREMVERRLSENGESRKLNRVGAVQRRKR